MNGTIMAPILLNITRFGKVTGWASHGGVFGDHSGSDVVLEKSNPEKCVVVVCRMIPAVAIVCFCIRFGNLMNSEIFGYPTRCLGGFEFVRSPGSGISCMRFALPSYSDL